MKLGWRIFLIILYFILGLIIAPFIGWAIFFATLPDTWRGLGKKGGRVPEPFDLKLTDADILPEQKTEATYQQKFDIKDIALYYGDRFGTG